MEKFGLFDLIEKFSASEKGKNGLFAPTATAKKQEIQKAASEESGTPPQYLMNAKMRDFVAKHEALSTAIDKNAQKDGAPEKPRRGRPKKSTAKTGEIKSETPAKSARKVKAEKSAKSAAKSNGKPKKSAKSAPERDEKPKKAAMCDLGEKTPKKEIRAKRGRPKKRPQ